jgi:glycosyltransferase involved in cell wall biosynthesis
MARECKTNGGENAGSARKPSVLLVIPAFNEATGIRATIQTIEDFKQSSLLQFNLDYIVINDGSTDDEERVLNSNAINHISFVHNLGIGGAVQAGYIYAQQKGYDIAVQFDGDGQHDIESLPDLLEPILRGEADFTVGSRFVESSGSEFKSSPTRQMGIRVLSFLIHLTSRERIKDVTSGYRAGNRKVIDLFVKRYPRRYPEPESYLYLFAEGIRVKEIGVRMFERVNGVSSISRMKSINYIIDVSLSMVALWLIGGVK